MKLTIKNMVCRHCLECVRRLLSDGLQLKVTSVELGVAEIDGTLTDEDLEKVNHSLESEGFELIHSREIEIIESIKRILIDLTYRDGEHQRENLQSLLDGKFGLSYASLSRLFSETEGRSLENYYICLRIERVKELIKYHQLTLSEIAYQTGFSSAAHLSRQFKQTTGLTPSAFKSLGGKRTPLPDL